MSNATDTFSRRKKTREVAVFMIIAILSCAVVTAMIFILNAQNRF